jgi:methionyl-tRNA formyltransferase
VTQIAVAGKGWVAIRVVGLLDLLGAAGTIDASVSVVRNRDDDGVDGWMPSLVRCARAWGVPVHDRVEDAGLGSNDVLLSLQHDRIVAAAALGGAAAFNLHFSDLPRYRGSLSSVWPIRRGEHRAGVTLHVLTDEVDGGPIVATRGFELTTSHTAFQLYLDYHRHGFDLVRDNLGSLLDGTWSAEPQDAGRATTFRRASVDFDRLEVDDFDRPAEVVRDAFRSLVFDPLQLPTFGGRPVRACSVLGWVTADGHRPGDVIGATSTGAAVACADAAVYVEFDRAASPVVEPPACPR